MQIVVDFITNYNWDNPATFLILLFVGILYLRKWNMIGVTTLTLTGAWLTRHLIVMNIRTFQEVIGVPAVVIAGGTALLVLMGAIAFTRFMIE